MQPIEPVDVVAVDAGQYIGEPGVRTDPGLRTSI
jgi:hypothetical protein